jgi:UDP:flavonoid glycosyltransferase YjiC (YdhE family)
VDVARSAVLCGSAQTTESWLWAALSATTEKSLVADQRRILAPQYVSRAPEIATRMTKPAASVAAAADLLEDFARLKHVG